jgi:hypothetical protein
MHSKTAPVQFRLLHRGRWLTPQRKRLLGLNAAGDKATDHGCYLGGRKSATSIGASPNRLANRSASPGRGCGRIIVPSPYVTPYLTAGDRGVAGEPRRTCWDIAEAVRGDVTARNKLKLQPGYNLIARLMAFDSP